MTKHAVGTWVEGKTKATADLQGVILAIDTSKVSLGTMSKGIAERSQLSLPQASHHHPESMTELLLSAAGADGIDVSPSSSESEASDEEQEAEEDELADGNTGSVAVVSGISDDGKVLAHNRSWEFCSSVLVDPAALLRKRTTSFAGQECCSSAKKRLSSTSF
ncbi:hypothetical protein PHYSODRAFT_302814 [Phytophthora sojae]|uniref:Uncharacterized protein n=1 Tax=Phytophthora sojae (strain P6497) TaxID=1094619 RepID=G4ZSU9_PHYSP|nr:hypothetical protein PHYSODRAFT_302814 [Phytophthora sojae]EGZ13034.1 hypothetical protein PHYSODRAFT_302814 [Phytophthora sojae]|eukprot:XP_009530463.1 hypothetical protein PHYSODRAFT_302814 [Phytophthora sojae]